MQNVESVYALSPMQQSMLVRILQAPHLEEYTEQVCWTVRGGLDVPAFARAWRRVVERSPVLRTAFFWEGLEQPLQVVRAGVEVEVAEHDWRGFPDADARFAEFLREDRRRGFDLGAAPLLRVALLRVADDAWRVAWSYHHLLLDGWSSSLAVREVFAVYEALREGRRPAPEPARPFGDFVAWLASRDEREAERFWRGYLAGFEAPTVLGIERAPDAGAGDEPRLLAATLPAGLAARLRRLVRRHGVTPNTLFQAAWGMVLGRFAGETDVVFGAVSSGRPPSFPGVDAMLGMFISTVPVRVHARPDAPLLPWLRELQAAQTTAREFDAFTVPQLQRWSEVPAGERLFDSLFVFQNLPDLETRGARVAGVELDGFFRGANAAQLGSALVLEVVPRDEVELHLTFDPRRIDPAAAARIPAHLAALLEAMAAEPGRTLSELPSLPPEERRTLLEAWNATARPFPRDLRVHDLFAAQARRTPDAPAAVADDRTLTYAELDASADALARELRARGAAPEDRVGILVGRGVGFAVAVLGVLKAGAAYVPLDPEYPAGRLSYVLADSGARLLVAEPELAARVGEWGGEVVAPDGTPLPPAPSPARGEGEHDGVEDTGAVAVAGCSLSPVPCSLSLAYVIYTSGSTGRPKGVAMPHRPVVNFALDMAARLGLGAGDRFLQFASPGFDVVVEELFPAWAAGGAVVFSRARLFSPAELRRVVERHGVTCFELPTAYWHEWVRELTERGERLPEPLRFVIVGGERVSAERLAEWARLDAPLVHVFGLTETACTSAMLSVAPGEDASLRWASLPVGRPTGNVRKYVLGPEGQPAPLGVPGELFVGGEAPARGYLGRPELTAERFVPDPFAGVPGARMYRTGDRVRWLDDGEMEFLGRIDHQVKLRGFRVEAGEVEAVLAEHPGVREALAVAREDGPAGPRLVAYLVPEAAGEPPADALREWAAARLPEYMVPSAFVALDAFPLTPHGKVDRRALPAPDAAADDGYTAPRTPAEQALAAIWAELLGVERVGVHDDFFRLGGHSLMAVRLASRARAALGVEVPVGAIFEAPTVARLAAAVAGEPAGAADDVPPVVPTPRDGPLPLSFAQQRLWLFDQVEPGSAVYNIPAALRVRGGLDARVLERSLTEVVRRHEVLRTVFRAGDDGEPVQVVLPAAPVVLGRIDLSGLPAGEREARLAEAARAEAAAPFDLRRGPLLRAALVRLGPGDAALLFTVHHVVSDEWSTEILVREVSALYGAFARGEPSPLPEPPVQYADFAAWQRARLGGAALERQLANWRERLSGAPPLLELPTDRPRTADADARGGVRPFALPAETAAALRALAADEAATPFMALLAGFQALLARWSGQDDVVVGTPVAGRGRPETEELIGFFVNTLVLRAELAGETTGRGLLRQARERVLEAQAHGDLPFERLVEELAPGRGAGHTPLFQVMFTLETLRVASGLRLGGVEVEPLPTDTATAKFDLALELVDEGGRIAGRAVYRSSLFDAATVDRLLEHYLRLLAGIAADPDAPVAGLALAGEAERRVLEEWNATAAPLPDRTLHELIAEQAARTPEAVAVAFEGETLTFSGLDARADALAATLRAMGVGPESRVGVCMERSAGLVAALLGVLRAGAAYVPLDPEYPAERLAYMLADAAVPVLLTQERLLGTIPGFGGEVVVVDTPHPPAPTSTPLPPAPSPARGEGENDTAIPEGQEALPQNWGRVAALRPPGGGLPADADNLAYVIYTSGSTGQPKGAMNEHRGIVNRLLWMQRQYGLTADDVVLQKTPFSFDVSVWEFFWPLLAGARLVLARPGGHRDPAYLSELIEREGVTTLHFVPSMLQAFLDAGETERCGSVRRVVCSGEALGAEVRDRFFQRWPGAELHNLYGPTEAAVDVTYHACLPGEPTVPIGRPVANTRIHVLDGRLAAAPVGVPGELYIAGMQVGRGYHGRPELTAERFVPDPFSAEAGARMYRTGDRARWLASGEVEYLGRLDAQVKVRGFRIEPGEVEAALRAHPGVRDAVVVARGAGAAGARLAAYHLPAEGAAAPGAGELREFLRGRLPDHMVPAAFVALDAFPLTPSGKLDRRALPEPAAEGGAAYTAPRTPAEEVLAGIWAEVLGLERVGVDDGFFELGGHSLLATRVVSRARAALGVELPVRALFEARTVAGLAARAEALRLAGGGVRVPPVVPVPRGRPLPLSFSQERLWFLDRLEPGSAHYNIATALRLAGPLRVDTLRRSLEAVVRRHEALRTVFAETDGGSVQVILPAGRFHLPLHDLSSLPEAEREAAMLRLAHDEAGGGFDLERGPLLRVVLVRLAAEEHALVLTMHHVVGDAWSLDVLWREASRCYGALMEGEPCALPPLPVQYADYAVWQREALAGEALEAQAEWWRAALEGATTLLALPTDRPRPRAWSHRAGEHSFALSAGVSDALRAAARREGATLFMALLAGLQLVLARYSGQDDVVVGTPVAGRTRAETEGLIGFFVNQLALRTRLGGDPTFAELLGRVREATLGAFAHQDLPFERLLEALRVERSPAHASVYQVTMVLHAAAAEPVSLPGVEVSPVPVSSASAALDLEIHFRDAPDGVRGTIIYAAGLYDLPTVAALAEHLAMALEEAAADPARRLSELSPLTPEERRQLLDEWTRTERPFPGDRGAHELFAEQAARTPDAVAVVHEAETLTYAELDRRAERVARLLRERGIGPESRVAVCMERAPEMLAAILGTLRAGAAFVPLDPANPRDRLAHVLADSGAELLLTQLRLLPLLPTDGVETVALDCAREEQLPSEGSALSHSRTFALSHSLSSAYVIYTSGSTGTPKGVVVEHRSLTNHAVAAAAEYGIGPADRVLQFASLAFDASLEEIFPALATGAALVLRGEEWLRGVPDFLERCAEHGVTVLDLPTAFWHEVAAELERGAARLPECVRLVIIGGERALPERVAAWHAAVGGRVRLVNTYGPTEATVVATLADVAETGAETIDGAVLAPVSIGRPVANARAYLLDGAMRPVPLGARGELYLGGAGVARGYLGRPGLTAEKFVPDPFSGEPGGRLFRTGDLARFRRGGELEFAGRADAQVKVRGFRVEPGEVEAALARLPGVREAAVVAREDEPGAVRLVAYVVPEAEDAPAADALRAGMKAALPEYMVPSGWVLLDRLPLTPGGKLDRRALPAPAAAPAAGHVPPRTATEAALAGVFAEVLRAERVGATDDFFALGGHSLLATRVVARVRDALGVELPLRALFEAPTVAALAERLDTLAGAEVADAAPPLVRVPRDGPMPLSFAQQRLWFLDRLAPGSAAYVMSFAFRLRGPLDARALERALAELARRHETLRTVFVPADDGGAHQLILPPAPPALPLADLSGLPAPAREAEARRLAAADAARPFDLERGPLLRATRLRLGDAEHAVLFALHHVVSDGWSMAVLVGEVSALYTAFAEGRPSPLPELPVQYADFAVWQRAWLSGGVLRRQLDYWRGRLAGAPPVLALPTDRPRPPVPGERGGVRPVAVPAEVVDGLRALARREGATLFAVLLAGWQLLLARWADEEDVVVGSPVAGRTRPELEPLIGFFVNTLALRLDVAGDPTVRELVGRARDTVLGGQAHQDLPFERLVEEVAPDRSLDHTPLFQATFALQNVEQAALRMGPLAVEPLDAGPEPAKFDLGLALSEEGDRLEGALSFRAELFDGATLERLPERYVRLLAGMAANPDGRAAGLALAGEAEWRRVLEEWNPVRAFPVRGTLHGAFAEQAARAPDAPAVTDGERVLTYAELDRLAGRLAGRLRLAGVGPEVPVAVCMERSAGMLVAILGVLKAGGLYVPLDPAHPAERLGWVLSDSAARVLVVQPHLADRFPEHGAATVRLHADGSGPEAGPETAPGVPVPPDSLAYVIYTSGSTGRPKGVMVSHASVLRLLDATDGWFGFGADDAWTLFHSFAFDFSVWEIWGALLRGGRLVVVPRDVGRDPAAFRALLARERVTVLNQTPSAFRQLAAADAEAGDAAGLALRWVVFGGEALEPAALRPWTERHGCEAPRLANMYGITETTVHVTFRPISREDVAVGAASPIGVPIPDLRVYVLDAGGGPAPTGFPGEMFVGGPGVARGYLGRPELTAERFVPDPFSGEAGARLYRSGDRARWSARGELEYLGRLDAQVKVRGFRIEPGEIEAALLAHPGVREAAVLAREDAPGDRRLAGYVVPAAGPVDAAELRGWLRGRLPEYMVPAAFVALETLPLTANGKLDRRALPAPERLEAEGFAAPRTPTEEVLAGIWAEVLGVDRVGAHTGFFDLGGHSLLATRVVSRVREAFGVELPLRALFEAPTVAGLAARVDAAAREGGGVQAPPLVPVPRDGPLPLSFAQQRLWFIDQLEPGSAAYNVPQARRLRGALDVGVLRRALDEVVRRHESLRTTFHRVGGRPVQVVSPGARAPLAEVDLRRLGEEARGAEAGRIAAEHAERPFDLARGPLLRATVARLGAEDFALLLNLHHVVSDGWSMEVLVRELSALYAAFREGRPSPLAPLPVQYADFAAWQRAWLEGPALDRQLAWWRERLAGAPPVLELPTDRPRPRVPGEAGGTRWFTLPDETGAALRALSRREGTTLFMTLLAAWQALLGRWAGRDDVVVGAPVAGRDRTEVEGLIGFFVNTLAMRTDLSGAPDGRELLRRVREAALGAYAHADIPFERLVEEIVPARSLSHAPLFQVAFSLQNADAAVLRLGEGELEELDAGGEAAKFDLHFAMADHGGRLGGTLAYRAELWDGATAERMLEHFGVLAGALAAEPGRPVAELPLLAPVERRHVLEGLNDTRRGYPAGERVHDLFVAQARRTPDAPAVSFRGETVSYAELEARSARLANGLRGLGVGPETRVGICLERTPELPAAMLAVLRAGGAYVPLDPAYPRERLGWMQEDARVSLVLTSGRLADALPAGTRALALDAVRAAAGAEPAGVPESGVLPENLSHVIFTSGSTGRPKGVMIRHSSVVVLLHWLREAVSDEERSALLFSTSVNFDVSVAEVFGTLCWGGKLVMVENALELASVAEPVVHASMVPTAAAELLRAGGIPAGVKTLNLGGEALPNDLAQALYRQLPTVRKVGNLYGPTEDTTYSTYSVVQRGASQVLVGRPVANTRALVLDAALEPVPLGVPGELYLAGDGLARGYASRPDLTAERFLPCPFGPPGSRMYRVKDRVRWRPDGELEYFGRTDFQVKVRGFRIEPGEIETALRSHPAVAETVVVVREDLPGDRRIVAYLVPPAGEEAPAAGELRARLRERVPEYMLPSAFVALERLPLTPNGKLDRLALPAPGERAGAEREYVAPRTPTEEAVAAAWAETLGTGRVGAHDNFFDLGGHSLLLVQLHSRLQERFGAGVSLAELFGHATLADLARRLDELRDGPAAEDDERRR
ncbi:MAG: non-ribosomal peptide synthase/polyketide synthase, partial [Gemmatimonadota bacterium]